MDIAFNRKLIHYYDILHIYSKSDIKSEREYAAYLAQYFGNGHFGGKPNFAARKAAKMLPLSFNEFLEVVK